MGERTSRSTCATYVPKATLPGAWPSQATSGAVHSEVSLWETASSSPPPRMKGTSLAPLHRQCHTGHGNCTFHGPGDPCRWPLSSQIEHDHQRAGVHVACPEDLVPRLLPTHYEWTMHAARTTVEAAWAVDSNFCPRPYLVAGRRAWLGPGLGQ